MFYSPHRVTTPTGPDQKPRKERLGFSRQHVVRLINAGEINARKLPSSSYWQIPLGSMLDFEQRREHAREQSDAFSRKLDQLGAPIE